MKTLTSKIKFFPKNFIRMRVVIHLQRPLKSNGNLERIWRNDQVKHGIKPVGRDSEEPESFFTWFTDHSEAGADEFSSVQPLSPVRFFATPWTAAGQASLSITNSGSLLKLISIESVMPFSHLILCCPLLLLPLIFPCIRVFSNESALHIRWPKCWSFRFNISPSNEHSGPIFFRMDWLDLLAVQGTQMS